MIIGGNYKDCINIAKDFLRLIILNGKFKEFIPIFLRVFKSKHGSLISKTIYSVTFFNKSNLPNYNHFFDSVVKKYSELKWDFNEKQILDLACGYGDFVYFLKKQIAKLRYTGIDFFEGYGPVWDFIANENKGVSFKVGEPRQLVKESLDKFKLIICLNAIMFYRDYEQFLKNLFFNSKRNTSYIISFSQTSKARRTKNPGCYGFVEITPKLFERKARGIGFKIINSTKFDYSGACKVHIYFLKK